MYSQYRFGCRMCLSRTVNRWNWLWSGNCVLRMSDDNHHGRAADDAATVFPVLSNFNHNARANVDNNNDLCTMFDGL